MMTWYRIARILTNPQALRMGLVVGTLALSVIWGSHPAHVNCVIWGS